jgi:hypothetical protein
MPNPCPYTGTEKSTASVAHRRPGRPGRRLRNPGVNARRPLSRSNFQVRKRPLLDRIPGMDLDWKATRRRRGKAQRRDNVRHDVAFDVVAMQVDLHGFVRSHTNYDLIVLTNRKHLRFGGRPFASDFERENAVFRMSVCDRRSEQRGDQQRASGVFQSRTRSRERSCRGDHRPRNA